MPYDPEIVSVYNLHPCERCYSALVAWMSKVLDRSRGSLASIKDALSRSPSQQDCIAVLNSCTCPPPYDAILEARHLKYDKTAQTYAVIQTMAGDCREGIASLQSFAALMRKCRGS